MATRRSLSVPEKLRESTKLLDMTMSEIRDAMDRNDGELRAAVLRVPRLRGQLRLKICCRRPVSSCWAMAVVLYSSAMDGRIDCIDFENRFEDIDGNVRGGFHRHLWDRAEGSCERHKVALPDFKPSDVGNFIKRGFLLLNIIPKEKAINDQLPID
jgi:hypothetical protein